MTNDIQNFENFGPIADAFKNSPVDTSKFTAGIGMAWPILTLRGKTWGWRFRGESKIYDAPNPSAGGAIMPVQHLDVVIVDAGLRISKVYYKEGWKDGSREPPSCWSADGITPDEGASEKQSPTCRGCRHNVFGSSIGDKGQKGKACADNKRLAVVTLNDLHNNDFGGPFMLRLPPGSFANYTTYVSVMASRGYPPFAIVTRLMFDPQITHPKVTFFPQRPLSNQEAGIVLAHQHNPRTAEMLNDKAVASFAEPEVDFVAPVAELPPAGEAPTPTASGWAAPAQANNAAPTKSVKTEAELRIEALEAQLAAATAAQLEPETPPKTPEQLRIEALEAQLAAAQASKTRKPRSKPVSPPLSAEGLVTSVGRMATQQGNGASTEADESSPTEVGNAIANRIASLIGKTSG